MPVQVNKLAGKSINNKPEAKKVLKQLSKLINPAQDKINIIEVEDDPIILGKNIDIKYEDGAIIIWTV